MSRQPTGCLVVWKEGMLGVGGLDPTLATPVAPVRTPDIGMIFPAEVFAAKCRLFKRRAV